MGVNVLKQKKTEIFSKLWESEKMKFKTLYNKWLRKQVQIQLKWVPICNIKEFEIMEFDLRTASNCAFNWTELAITTFKLNLWVSLRSVHIMLEAALHLSSLNRRKMSSENGALRKRSSIWRNLKIRAPLYPSPRGHDKHVISLPESFL